MHDVNATILVFKNTCRRVSSNKKRIAIGVLRCDEIFYLFSCWSYIGRTGSKQLLSLAPDCWRHGTVVHEIGRSEAIASLLLITWWAVLKTHPDIIYGIDCYACC